MITLTGENDIVAFDYDCGFTAQYLNTPSHLQHVVELHIKTTTHVWLQILQHICKAKSQPFISFKDLESQI